MLKKKGIVALMLAIVMCCSMMTASMTANAKNVVTDVKLGPVSQSTLQQWSNALTTNEQWVMMDYLEKQSAWKTGYDIIAQSGWLYNPTTKMAYTYETQRSLEKKIEYINNKGLGGIICWDAQGDDMGNWTMFNKMKNGLKANGKEVIAYFGNWMAYGDDTEHTQGQWAQNLPWDQVTCINYSFFGVSDGTVVDKRNSRAVPKYKIVTLDEYVDFGWEHTENPSQGQWGDDTGYTDEKAGVGAKYGQGSKFDEYYHFDQLEEIGIYGAQHPEVRIMLSIGGWTRSHMFHEMASTAANRKVFIDSCVEFLKDFPHFDGMDLDWEYPGFEREPEDELDQGNPAGPEDRENFTALVKEMRTAFDKAFPNQHKYISTCTASDQNLKLTFMDLKGIEPYVDYMNIMTYDYTGTWEPTLNGYNSPIFAEGDGTEWCVDNSVKYFENYGVDLSKVNIGCPLYSYGFKNVQADANGNPVDLPNPIANGLKGNAMSMPVGMSQALDVVYTFYDGSERTPTQVHNPVKATVTSGSQYVSLSTDKETGEITVKGLQNGTATIKVTDDLDGFSTNVTVNVAGEIKPLTIKSVTASNNNGTYTLTCNAEGGFTPYTYYGYVLKGGKVYGKMVDSSNKSFTCTPGESGTYTVIMYCKDANRTMVKGTTTFTVA